MNPKITYHPCNMPTEDYNSDRWARNILCNLDLNDLVDIHFESNVSDCGEQWGQWDVYLERSGKQVSVRHDSILQALWAATNQMAHEMDNESKRQEATRAAALAKLTPEERKLLKLF